MGMEKKRAQLLSHDEFHPRGGGGGVFTQPPAQICGMLKGAVVVFIGNSFCRSTYLDMVRMLSEKPANSKVPVDTQLVQSPEVREANLSGDTLVKYFHSRECYGA